MLSLALARTREALHNSWDKNDPKDAQVFLHTLRIRATQVYHDPLRVGINDVQELSKTHEAIARAKKRSRISILADSATAVDTIQHLPCSPMPRRRQRHAHAPACTSTAASSVASLRDGRLHQTCSHCSRTDESCRRSSGVPSNTIWPWPMT